MTEFDGRLSRRNLLKWAGLGGAAIVMAGCGGTAPAPTVAPAAPAASPKAGETPKPAAATAVAPAAPGAKTPVTVKFTGGTGADSAVYDIMFDKFESMQKDIKVDRNYDPGLDNTKTIAMIRTGTFSDIGHTDDDAGFMLACSGVVNILDDYIAKDLKRGDYYDWVWNSRNGPGGEMPYFHIGESIVLSFYNVELFQKKGIKAPTDWTTGNWSMEQLNDALKELTEKKGDRVETYGIAWPNWITSVGMYGWGNEPYWKESSGGKVVADIATPGRIEWTQKFVVDWIKNGYKVPPGENTKALFDGGKCAIWMEHMVNVGNMKKGLNFDVMPTWRGKTPEQTVVCNASRTYANPTSSKQRDATWELGKFMWTTTGQEIAAEQGMTLPGLKAVAEGPKFLDSALGKNAPSWKTLMAKAGAQRPFPWPRNPASEAFMFHPRRMDNMQMGKVGVKEYLEQEGNAVCQRVLDQAQWTSDKDVKGWRFPNLIDTFLKEEADAAATAAAGKAAAAATPAVKK